MLLHMIQLRDLILKARFFIVILYQLPVALKHSSYKISSKGYFYLVSRISRTINLTPNGIRINLRNFLGGGGRGMRPDLPSDSCFEACMAHCPPPANVKSCMKP